MQIRIRYKRHDEATPHEIELTPDEYFDPLDPGETLSVRSVAKHLDAHKFTPYRADELAWTVEEISDGESFWRVRTQLLDGMRALMHHSQQGDGTEELIHSTQLSTFCWHTIRTLKLPNQEWAVVLNSLTVEQPSKLMESKYFCERWTFEELKAFGQVS